MGISMQKRVICAFMKILRSTSDVLIKTPAFLQKNNRIKRFKIVKRDMKELCVLLALLITGNLSVLSCATSALMELFQL